MKLKTTAKYFAYDDCHKIYLLEDTTDIEQAKQSHYKIYHISFLQDAYNTSCSLRFINNWKLTKTIIPQFKHKGDIKICLI